MSDQIINRFNLSADAMIRQAERIKENNKYGAGNVIEHPQSGQSFQQILDQRLSAEEISFSKHANQRAVQRSIALGGTELKKLTEACEKADKKGIRDALVVMNDSAFIVNTANKVVITVMDKNEMKENIFTNIDGALFI